MAGTRPWPKLRDAASSRDRPVEERARAVEQACRAAMQMLAGSPERELARALDALRGAGFTPEDDPETLSRQAREEGQFRGTVSGMRVDVFVPAIPYYAELEGRRRRVVLLGRPLSILAPHDLVV